MKLNINGVEVSVDALSHKCDVLEFTLSGKTYRFTGKQFGSGFTLDEEVATGQWQRNSGTIWHGAKNAKRIQLGAVEASVLEPGAGTTATESFQTLSPVAPMPGLVRKILVKKGDKISAGQPLLVFEAMKLQLTMSSDCDALVKNIPVTEGQMVPEGTELVSLTPAKKG